MKRLALTLTIVVLAGAAWTAFEVSLGVLESWLLTHPRTIVASAIGDAQKALEEVRIQIERAGLLEVWGRELPRH